MPNALRRVVWSVLLACALAAAGVQPAVASTNTPSHAQGKLSLRLNTNKEQRKLCRQANVVRKAVIRKHGKRAPGRDICRYGQRDGSTPTVHKLEDYLHTLQRIKSPPQVVAPVRSVSPTAVASSTASSVAGSTLSAIAQCESGGNPAAVSPDGTYRGKYQFTYSTWASVGGTGDPAAAPESVQDALAKKLYSQQGAAPWPVCGR